VVDGYLNGVTGLQSEEGQAGVQAHIPLRASRPSGDLQWVLLTGLRPNMSRVESMEVIKAVSKLGEPVLATLIVEEKTKRARGLLQGLHP
ncbi:hypothetical protein, partial [Infirmifilum sp.]|uniref:hypothetical protein n=1 Tax=Infirmifilum sp. TaxID=2856575 RepID=UPI003D113CB5